MAHPVAPSEEELAAIRMEIVRAGVAYEFDLRMPAERMQDAVRANIQRALRWLSWLGRSFPETTFIAPWIAAILSGENDSDPAQREAGLVDCCATVERCDGIAMVGGRIGSGGARERDHGVATGGKPWPSSFGVYDLTGLGAEPPLQLCNLTLGGWHPNAFRRAGCGQRAETGLICLSRMGLR